MTPDAVLEWAQIERDSLQPPKPTATDRGAGALPPEVSRRHPAGRPC
jgi:hypothetical protein